MLKKKTGFLGFTLMGLLALVSNAWSTSPVSYVDSDSDGYDYRNDCDESDSAINPGATEVCDYVDNDCDGETDEGVLLTYSPDEDGDGWADDSTTMGCTEPSVIMDSAYSDCNDADSAINPGATEVCDEVDNDCDGTVDEDCAEDSAGSVVGDNEENTDSSSPAAGCSLHVPVR